LNVSSSYSISRRLKGVNIVVSTLVAIPFSFFLISDYHFFPQDARNISRILAALAKKGERLVPNMTINPRRRWPWMGKKGKILEEYILVADGGTISTTPGL
jgi:hypothetical protein